mgnify:CR=1 FL=1
MNPTTPLFTISALEMIPLWVWSIAALLAIVAFVGIVTSTLRRRKKDYPDQADNVSRLVLPKIKPQRWIIQRLGKQPASSADFLSAWAMEPSALIEPFQMRMITL